MQHSFSNNLKVKMKILFLDIGESMEMTEKNNLDNFDEKKRNEEGSNSKNVEGKRV